ncbi:uncharacterized protein [Miscanthus floridulus]|uniref:uncharacterized protein n=1 Tax=Miscanthus floridulus TaxID=154761 RepID=UPI0034595CC2
MDGGSGLNILYANTLELLEIDRLWLWGDATPSHGIVPGKRTRPLWRIDLHVCFGTPSNYRKEALVEAETLIIDLDRLGSQLPKPKRRARMFEPAEAIKLAPVDPACPDDRALRISATLDIK